MLYQLDLVLQPIKEKIAQEIEDKPIRDAWDQPEDPNYLVPLAVSKEGDFAKVVRCEVLASDLGYRVKSAGKKRVDIIFSTLGIRMLFLE